jgi:serine/threonine-protein kinase HipA
MKIGRAIRRREAMEAKREQRKPHALTDVDFLLGVYDETRMGALRFSTKEEGPFLSNMEKNCIWNGCI